MNSCVGFQFCGFRSCRFFSSAYAVHKPSSTACTRRKAVRGPDALTRGLELALGDGGPPGEDDATRIEAIYDKIEDVRRTFDVPGGERRASPEGRGNDVYGREMHCYKTRRNAKG